MLQKLVPGCSCLILLESRWPPLRLVRSRLVKVRSTLGPLVVRLRREVATHLFAPWTTGRILLNIYPLKCLVLGT